MREIFQSQLHEVQTRLVEIAEDSARIIEKASKAFTTSDVILADEAIAMSEVAGEKALALDELVIRIFPFYNFFNVFICSVRYNPSIF